MWKVKLTLDGDYPSAPPKGFFVTKIFHPNVSAKGEICVNTLKKDWKPELGVRHVLLTVKCLLIHPNPESALNEEAGKLLLEKYEDYCKHAALMTGVHGKKIKWEDISTASDSVEETEEASKENDVAATNAVEAKVEAKAVPVVKKKVPAPAAKAKSSGLKRL